MYLDCISTWIDFALIQRVRLAFHLYCLGKLGNVICISLQSFGSRWPSSKAITGNVPVRYQSRHWVRYCFNSTSIRGMATPTAGVGNWIRRSMGRRAIRISHFAGKWGLGVQDSARLYSALMLRNLLYPNSSKPAPFIAVYHKPGHLDESSRIQFYFSLSPRYSNFSMKARIFYGISRYRRVWAF